MAGRTGSVPTSPTHTLHFVRKLLPPLSNTIVTAVLTAEPCTSEVGQYLVGWHYNKCETRTPGASAVPASAVAGDTELRAAVVDIPSPDWRRPLRSGTDTGSFSSGTLSVTSVRAFKRGKK